MLARASGSSACPTGSRCAGCTAPTSGTLVLELPEGSRVEYQLEVRRGEHYERFNDPLNPKRSHSPVGSSSVCFARGYETPDWCCPDPEARPGELHDLVRAQPGAAARLHGDALPARAVPPTARYPLLVVHDGGDFLQYAATKTVLDNLIHRLDVAEIVVAFTAPRGPAGRVRRTRRRTPGFLTHELVPQLEAELPLRRASRPGAACWARASARVAALSRGRTGRRTPTGRCC